jgi:DNA-binding response OmpR family regulator
MRVLLVDDEYELISTLAERMAMRGIDTDWAISGEEALAKIAEQTYDVVVIDIKMPRIGGLETKRKMQALRPGLKFIFMTGHGSETDFKHGSTEAGGDRFYLMKPVEIKALISKIYEAHSGAPSNEEERR